MVNIVFEYMALISLQVLRKDIVYESGGPGEWTQRQRLGTYIWPSHLPGQWYKYLALWFDIYVIYYSPTVNAVIQYTGLCSDVISSSTTLRPFLLPLVFRSIDPWAWFKKWWTTWFFYPALQSCTGYLWPRIYRCTVRTWCFYIRLVISVFIERGMRRKKILPLYGDNSHQ
jgi:hypothetical protein